MLINCSKEKIKERTMLNFSYSTLTYTINNVAFSILIYAEFLLFNINMYY